jgi:hypothetical protein
LTPALGGNLIFLINRQFRSLKGIQIQKTTTSKYFDLKKNQSKKKTTGSGYLEEEENNYQQKRTAGSSHFPTLQRTVGFH